MSWPSSDVTTTHADSPSDAGDPAAFRADALDLITKFNQLRNHVSTLGQTLIARATAALMRSDLGAAASGANADITGLQNPSGIQYVTRADVASATTVVLSSVADDIRITGTAAITAFTIAVGRVVRVTFSGSLTLTNNANIVTQTGANITTQAGDTCMLRATAVNTVEVLGYVSAFQNTVAKSMIRMNTASGYGITDTKIRGFTNTVTSQGTDITHAYTSANGSKFTINTSGVYSISYQDNLSAADVFGLSLNSSQLTTSIATITSADVLQMSTQWTANVPDSVSWTGYLAAGSVVRAHTSGAASGSGPVAQFTISKVS